MFYVYFLGENDTSIFTINSRFPIESLVHSGNSIICKFFHSNYMYKF